MGLGATYRRHERRGSLLPRRGSRGLADARAAAIHAPRIGAQQPAGPALASLSRFHPHHDRRGARRRRRGRRHVRVVGLSRCRAGRKSAQPRTAAPRFVGGARAIQHRPMARPVLRRAPAPAGVVRSLRRDAAHCVSRIRRADRHAAVERPHSRGAAIGRTTGSMGTPMAIWRKGNSSSRRVRPSTDAPSTSARIYLSMSTRKGFSTGRSSIKVGAFTAGLSCAISA